jgi:hypothetical protein
MPRGMQQDESSAYNNRRKDGSEFPSDPVTAQGNPKIDLSGGGETWMIQTAATLRSELRQATIAQARED